MPTNNTLVTIRSVGAALRRLPFLACVVAGLQLALTKMNLRVPYPLLLLQRVGSSHPTPHPPLFSFLGVSWHQLARQNVFEELSFRFFSINQEVHP